MNNSCDINWERTLKNINSRLEGKTYAKCFSALFGVDCRAAEYKLLDPFKSIPSIKDLAMVARYLRCDILDLLVFENERYVDDESINKDKSREVEHTSSRDVVESFEMANRIEETYEIRDVYELLLYLPLIDESILRDVVYRCVGNLEWGQRDYVKKQLSYLHYTIPDSPEKEYADSYRDNVLRVKGNPKNNSYRSKHGKDYLESAYRYREVGASYIMDDYLEFCREYMVMRETNCNSND